MRCVPSLLSDDMASSTGSMALAPFQATSVPQTRLNSSVFSLQSIHCHVIRMSSVLKRDNQHFMFGPGGGRFGLGL